MANVALHQLLGTMTVTRAISRIKTPMSRLQTFMGMQPGGPANVDQGGDKFGYDIFDKTRAIAMGRPPGTGPATRAPKSIGHVTVSAYRAHEQILLQEAQIFRTRPIGGQWGDVDVRGQRYVTKQEEYLSQLFRNHREFMVSRMLLGGFQILIQGDNWIPVDSGGTFSVSYQVPATNLTKLNMTGGGDIIGASWATTASTDIPGNLLQINAAFEQQHGRPLRHLWCNSVVYAAMLKNAALISLAGSANTVFSTYEPTGITSDEGIQDTGFTAVFRGVPWLTVHVYDGGLDVNGTYTKFFDDTHALFLPDPSPDWAEWYNGSEIVAENVADPGSERFGLSAWTTRTIDPAGFQMKALDVGIPVLYVPKCIAYGSVIY